MMLHDQAIAEISVDGKFLVVQRWDIL